MAERNREKLYGLFVQTRNGVIYGLCENSFSMSYRLNTVRVWNQSNAILWLEDLQHRVSKKKTKISYRGEPLGFVLEDTFSPSDDDIIKCFLSRVNSKSPLKINLKGRRKAPNKFFWRNRPFRVVQTTVFKNSSNIS
jgi:hypothetical protein